MATVADISFLGEEAEGHVDTLEASPAPDSTSLIGSVGSTSTGTSVGTKDYKITGEVQLHLAYKDGKLSILVDSATGLTPIKQGHYPNPYVKIYLLPDKTKQAKQKTKTKRNTTNPVYKETLTYTVEESLLNGHTLWVSIRHHRRIRRNLFLGEVYVPLSSLDPTKPAIITRQLQDKDNTSHPQRVELELGLKFDPGSKIQSKSGTRTRGTLYVKVKQARELPVMDPRTLTNATVKCYLLPDSSSTGKRKTPVSPGTLDPVWEETFTYETTQEGLMEGGVLEITVKDDRSGKVIGGLRLGSILSPTGSRKKKHRWMDSSEDEAAHWQEMLANPGEWVESWHDLRPNMKLLKPVSLSFNGPQLLQSVEETAPLDTRTSAPEGQHVPLQGPKELTGSEVILDFVDQKTILTEADLQSVFEEVVGLAHLWKLFGSALGVKGGDIKAIDRNCRGDVKECLMEVLRCWLKRRYIVNEKFGLQPNWRSLVRAVECHAGGADPALAKTIAERHPLLTSLEPDDEAIPDGTEVQDGENDDNSMRHHVVETFGATNQVEAVSHQGRPILLQERPSVKTVKKVVLLGESFVGKSSLFTTFFEKKFIDVVPASVQATVRRTEIVVHEKTVEMEVWDTAGSERFHSETEQIYRNADGVVFVFDITQKDSFEMIKTYWMKKVMARCRQAAKVLVGNKCDLQAGGETQLREIRRYAEEHGMKYLETSVTQKINVQEVFQEIASEMCNREEQVNRGAEPPIRLTRDSKTVETQVRSRKKCSC